MGNTVASESDELGKEALQLLGRMHVQGAYQMAMRE
jgi:hypothetical protein